MIMIGYIGVLYMNLYIWRRRFLFLVREKCGLFLKKSLVGIYLRVK
jgi:hypothetical protein